MPRANRTTWKKGDMEGSKNYRWKGGKSSYYRNKARKIMEKKLDRTLKLGEIVHHIDGNIKNNKIRNLMLLPSQSKHVALHNKQRKGLKRVMPIRDKHKDTITKLTKELWSAEKIADALDIATNTVLRARKDAGIKTIVIPGINKIVGVNYNVS